MAIKGRDVEAVPSPWALVHLVYVFHCATVVRGPAGS